MLEMRQRYGVPVGLSDHTLTNYASFAAVALGATVIEKHFTLSRLMYGSDAKHSLEPAEFTDLVNGIRATGLMLSAPVDKDRLDDVRQMKTTFEKSIVSRCRIPAGVAITAEMLAIKKPGSGLPPARLGEVLGRRAARTIEADEVLTEADVAWTEPQA